MEPRQAIKNSSVIDHLPTNGRSLHPPQASELMWPGSHFGLVPDRVGGGNTI